MFNSLDDDIEPPRGGTVSHYNDETVLSPSNAALLAKRGRRFMVMLGAIGVGGAVTIGLSVSTLTIFENYYDFTLRFLVLLEAKTEGTEAYISLSGIFGTAVILPLISGILVVIAVGFTIFVTYERAEEADEQADEALRKGSAVAKGLGSFGDETQVNRKLACLTLKSWFCAGYSFLLLLVVGQLLGFIGTIVAIGSLSRAVELSASGIRSASLLEVNLANLQLAMFNQCCEASGFSEQGTVDECDVNGQPVGCTISDPQFTSFTDQLCVCYTSTTTQYNQDIGRIQESGVCALLRDAIVGIGDQDVVPGSNFRIKELVPADQTRVVGFQNAPVLNPDALAREPRGYGCGRGYARGFQYFMFQFIFQSSVYIASIGLFVSIGQLIVLVAMACLMCQYWAADSDDDDFAVEGGGNVVLTTRTLEEMQAQRQYEPTQVQQPRSPPKTRPEL